MGNLTPYDRPLQVRPMRNALTVAQARSKLGRLADQVVKGKSVYLKRGTHLLRLERVNRKAGIPSRPVGYFKFDNDLTDLANRAETKFAII